MSPHPLAHSRYDRSNGINALAMTTSGARHVTGSGDLHAAMISVAGAAQPGQRCVAPLHHAPPPD